MGGVVCLPYAGQAGVATETGRMPASLPKRRSGQTKQLDGIKKFSIRDGDKRTFLSTSRESSVGVKVQRTEYQESGIRGDQCRKKFLEG